jgi:integrase
MGVKIHKRRGGKWFVFVSHCGRRKAKSVGSSRQVAEEVKRQIEARLALGDLGFLAAGETPVLTFDTYADQWMKNYARVECKTSTADGYEGVLRQYLRPRFGTKRLDEIKRDEIKAMINDMISKDLSRNTIRNALCVVRGLFNEAIEAGLLEANRAARLGRFTRAAKTPENKGIALTATEVQTFLEAANEVCPENYGLFLTAVRGGLRRGELVALQWGDIQLGTNQDDPNRFILVQHNFVKREHTTTKSRKSRRVDLSRELRRTLIELRDKRLLEAFLKGKNDISDELVFPSPDGTVLDPDNLYHRYFLPVLAKAGIRKIRLHDLRHTFGSLLIQNGATLPYVKDQMGHSSIQVTVDTYGHLIPGANVSFVDTLDATPKVADATTPQQNATPAQLVEMGVPPDLAQVVEEIGGGGRTRTYDLRIMRPSL